MDECDAIEASAEGDPITLAERRTLSFANRKIVSGGTPLDEATSAITRLYGQSDQRIWEMPCPECGIFAEIRWANIEWPSDHPEAAAWRCPSCSGLIEERHMASMARKGRWRALRPDAASTHRGYRINALASLLPNTAWGKLAAEFVRVKDDPTTLRVFVNTILGEPWHEEGDELDQTALVGRAEDFSLDAIPSEAIFLTAGCDVQVDRLELTILGHARDGAVYVLAHEVLWGSPVDEETWAELDRFLKRAGRTPAWWPVEDRRMLRRCRRRRRL